VSPEGTPRPAAHRCYVAPVGEPFSQALPGRRQQGGGGEDVSSLAGRQMDRDGQSMRLGQHIDLGAEAPT
jgi:hypothetical protein